MINLVAESGVEKYGICHFVIDTPADLPSVPTEGEMGSTCFIISTSEKYMLNSQKEWIKIALNGGSGESDSEVI